MSAAEFTELSEPSELFAPDADEGTTKPLALTAPTYPAEPAAAELAAEPAATEPSAEPLNSELTVIRNELTSALHEAHYQRRKRADAVQLLAYERLVRRAHVAGSLWLVVAAALIAAGVWAFLQSTVTYDYWQIGAASAAALAIVCIVVSIVAWAGPNRARQSLSLRQVRRLTPPEMLSEAWFHAAHEVGTPREYRRAFHGLV